MLDIGWSELLLIGMVALIVIGPKDLPQMFRALGRMTAKARSMAREFSQAMEDAAKTSGVDDAANTLRDMKSITSKKSLGLDALDRAAERFEKWDPKISNRSSALPDPGLAASPAAPTAATPLSAAVPAVAPTAAAATVPAATETASAGSRRLRAVRRRDLTTDEG